MWDEFWLDVRMEEISSHSSSWEEQGGVVEEVDEEELEEFREALARRIWRTSRKVLVGGGILPFESVFAR